MESFDHAVGGWIVGGCVDTSDAKTMEELGEKVRFDYAPWSVVTVAGTPKLAIQVLANA